MTDSEERMEEHHQRRMMLIREMGKTNRMETRLHILWVVAAVLGILALLLSIQ